MPRSFIDSEEGSAATEYALLGALVAVLAVVALAAMGSSLTALLAALARSLGALAK